jgi:aminomuconate-semialdehyde/2-hydroxymuconate-6-semialdehyde dehydrogenase
VKPPTSPSDSGSKVGAAHGAAGVLGQSVPAAGLKIPNYLAGQFAEPLGGGWLDNYEPATGRVYSQVADSDARDVEQAAAAAAAAFPSWSRESPAERGRVLNRIADLIEQQLEALARDESQDTGKPLAMARSMDIPRAVANLRFFAAIAQGFASESHASDGVINYTLRQPLGVVGCISPWNLPLYLLTWKIAPALAAGNTVLAKPSELTPLTAFRLSELCIQAGLPGGVLNIVQGRGPTAGQSIVEHPLVKAISFTGGTVTGRRVAELAATRLKRVSLEMGGKNASIVFGDCDFDQAIAGTVRSSFWNQGQLCLCGSRVLVERSVYEPFRDRLVERATRLKVGDPLEEVDLGAVVSSAHRDKIMDSLRLAKEEGGRVLCGGTTVAPAGRVAGGWFVAPTVIEGLGPTCRTNQEEIFGPVVTLQPFDSDEEAIALANATRYGLAAALWTRDVNRAHRVAARLEAGIVWINCWLVRDLRTPFGGVKDSGVGREGGWEALRFFTESKNVCVKFD